MFSFGNLWEEIKANFMKKLLITMASATALAFAASCTQQLDKQISNGNYKMKAVQFRIARPTNNLNEVVKFYNDILGMEIIGKFEDHLGYDGVMLGMPDKTYHLEFTQQAEKFPLPEPTKENLLVLYYDNEDDYKRANDRFKNAGIGAVEPENPYWKDKSVTYEDPDGWRVVLFNGVYNP